MTAAAGTPGMFEERIDPGRVWSIVLAAAMHLALVAVLMFGVSWQNRPPEAVQVELWTEPAPAPAPVEAQPAPAPEPVAVKPEPVIPKPEIALKEPAKIKPAVKPVARPEPLKAKVDDTQKRMREELAREQASLAMDRERQLLKEQIANESAAARTKSMADWASKVRTKIRGNVVLPLEVKGNPEAIFDVVQLPTGEVLSAKLRKSSGNQVLDDAIERAILKSSPLPRPDRSESAPRAFELKYRPLD